MDKKKKIYKIIKKIFYLLLISFIALYFSKENGYYEFVTHRQVELNEAQIKKFENDVKGGKDINLTDYVDEKKVSYSNTISNIGYNLSDQIGNLITNGLDGTFSFLGQLFG